MIFIIDMNVQYLQVILNIEKILLEIYLLKILFNIFTKCFIFLLFKDMSVYFKRLFLFFIDLKGIFSDTNFYVYGCVKTIKKPKLIYDKFKVLFNQFNDRRKYILKKYVYTINHKRIAINYLFFSM
jgi:hypothetical protein